MKKETMRYLTINNGRWSVKFGRKYLFFIADDKDFDSLKP